MICFGLVVALVAGTDPFEPLLFMDMQDVSDAWGLIEPVANTVEPNGSFSPPPMVDFPGGSLVIAVIASVTSVGIFEVYAENTTGWEPLVGGGTRGDPSGAEGAVRSSGIHNCALLRYTTTDFVHYSTPVIALRIVGCSGTPTMKSIARSPSGLYAMFTTYGTLNGGLGTFTSTDTGLTWSRVRVPPFFVSPRRWRCAFLQEPHATL